MKVIQLRGTNAIGKTTAVRDFISHGSFVVSSMVVDGTPVEYHWEEKRRIAVLGRYDKAVTGGIDGHITDKKTLVRAITRALDLLHPNVLIFEGIVYGVTFKFAYELAGLLKAKGYEYVGICLVAPLEVVFERLSERNGGKPIDSMSVQNKWFSSLSAYRKLKESGINVKAIETTRIKRGLMYKIIEEEVSHG